jgi:hypothetical protein
MEFLVSRITNVPEEFFLLENVRFEFLTHEGLLRLKLLLEDPEMFDRMNKTLWQKIVDALGNQSTTGDPDRHELAGMAFPLTNAKPPEGIIAYLTRKTRGNVHTNHTIVVTSSGAIQSGMGNPLDFKGDHWFQTGTDHPDQWICYDFKTRQIILTGYSIRSNASHSTRGNQLKSWVVEVSKDGTKWQTADTRENDELNQPDTWRSYSTQKSGICRFVRLRTTGPNHDGKNGFIISSWELFGRILDEK